ncbi:hypothetical protein Mal15_06320 [Stieleria maiorica]|uniref:VWFA domain-containing protein n=1 Tax=Stieleria maiorica TaxID=2795974 RepID=A0A5B9MAN1_9BACT|nr:hypothetical protein [Stieleria maiorica]QEF96604.1 hypothetical protein Mal15_06320 [Stieleria maiorica]
MAPARKRWLTDGLDLDSNSRDPLPLDYPPQIPGACRSAADSVVYRGPPPVADGDSRSDDPDRPRAFPIPLDLSPRRREFESREKSAWVGSIIVHAAIVLLIAFLIAPADFSGYTTQTLVMTLSEEQPEIPIPMMLVDDVASEDSSLLAEVEEDPEIVKPVEVSLDVARPVIKLAGMKTKSGKSVGNVSGGARGSFFGIEAVGQDFVYIVDRSGSMNGVRYRRAIDELTRSIRELREDQRFFVLLFSSSSTPMFNGVQSMDMMQATAENKERLEDWLATIGTGGGTNPNSSLRTALRMNPNAVFMLSDGEFTETKSGKRGTLLKAGGDALSIAQASGTSIPIHAIAFEDPRSCKNMKELAELTGGEYRFVNSSGKTQRELLADARALMAEPKSKSRMRRQGQLSHQIGSIQVSEKAKQTYADLLVDDFEDAYGKIGEPDAAAPVPPLSELLELLEALVSSDPRRIALAPLQDKVAGELSRRLHEVADTAEVESACDAIIRWRGSRAATSVLDRVADHLATLNHDEPSKAFTRLRLIKRLHPQSKAVDVCQTLCDRIRDQIVQQSNQLLQRGDLVAAIRMLRTTSSGEFDPTVRSLTYQTLRDLTMKQLAAARDASLSHNRELKDSINAQLQKGFENDPLLDQWRKERVSRELNARRMLLQVGNNHRYAGIKQKRQQLQAIIDRYPEAIAATQAQAQLDQLPRWEAAVEQEESELIRMMDDTRRR